MGASKPEEYGDYYAWGETETKDKYDEFNYKWRKGDGYSKYITNELSGENKTTLDPEDDVAHVKWGGSWRMPTKAELDELVTSCTWTWTSLIGVEGCRITSDKKGYTDRSIFLPASFSALFGLGYYGVYRCNSLSSNSCTWCIDFGHTTSDEEYFEVNLLDVWKRYSGFSVRPVCP